LTKRSGTRRIARPGRVPAEDWKEAEVATDPRIRDVLISLNGNALPSITGVLRGVDRELAC